MSVQAAVMLLRLLLLLLAMVGVVGVASIAWSQFSGVESCPALGVVPACYVALAGYSLVTLSALLPRSRGCYVAVVGLLAVLTLAATGSGLELVGVESCPRSSAGQPMCYYSLGLGIALAATYAGIYRLARQVESRPIS